MAVDFPDHPFWDFSLEVYGKDGVPQACLVLQERHHIDVNVLLFCCWLGASGRGAMTEAETGNMVGAVDTWHETVVRELRAVRQRMKGGMPPAPIALSDPLRSRIAKIEVDCEHVEQLMLTEAVDRPANAETARDRRADDAIKNIGSYFNRLGVSVDGTDHEPMGIILGAAFSDLGQERLDTLCRSLEAA